MTLTASVSPQIAGVPTGTVTFTADGQPLGNAPLGPSGSAAFTTAGLAPGTQSISASYAGDGNFLSAPPPLSVKIIVNPTTPQAQLSAATLQYGTIAFPGTETMPLMVTNIGGGTLTISTSINGPGYKITSSSCGAGVTAGNNCTLQVEFDPLAVGTHNDTLTLQTNGSANPTVALKGIGSGVVLQTPTPLLFGTIPFGTTSVLTLTITDVGVPGTVTLATMINGASYKILTTTQNTCQAGITTGQSCVLPVEFNPVAVGPHNDTLTLTPNAGAQASQVPDWTAHRQQVGGVNPDPLQFGTIPFGATEIPTLTIADVGVHRHGHAWRR